MFVFSFVAFADVRDFPYTYQARTLPQGSTEFEFYLDGNLPDLDNQTDYSWKQQFELEYGLLDRLSVALYNVFTTNQLSSGEYRTKFDKIKLQAKYKLLQTGEFIVDPLLYFEYMFSSNFDGNNDKFEVKQVVSKEIDKFIFALNLSEEISVKKSDWETKDDFELAYDLGAGFEPMSYLNFGAQAKGLFYSNESIAIGPYVSFKHSRLYADLGVLFGLNDNADDLGMRLLVGITI
jgi:hypothetical protein